MGEWNDDKLYIDTGSDFLYGGAESDILYGYDTISDTLVGGNGTGTDCARLTSSTQRSSANSNRGRLSPCKYAPRIF